MTGAAAGPRGRLLDDGVQGGRVRRARAGWWRPPPARWTWPGPARAGTSRTPGSGGRPRLGRPDRGGGRPRRGRRAGCAALGVDPPARVVRVPGRRGPPAAARRSSGWTAGPTAEIAELGSPGCARCPGSRRTSPPPSTSSPGWPGTSRELLRSAARVAEVHAFLAERLTGRWVTSTGSADSLGLLDLRGRRLVAGAARAGRRPPRPAPRPGAAGRRRSAPLLPEVAAAIGLPRAGAPRRRDRRRPGRRAGRRRHRPPEPGYLNLGTSMVHGRRRRDGT